MEIGRNIINPAYVIMVKYNDDILFVDGSILRTSSYPPARVEKGLAQLRDYLSFQATPPVLKTGEWEGMKL